MINHDKIGPEKIIQVYDPKTRMKGILVIDSLKLGPGKGGIRMTPTVSVEEVFRLARAMTLKNSLADLPFGGAKSGIIFNPKESTKEEKLEIVKAYSRAIKELCPEKYIAAPDINMGEQEMRAFVEANGSKKSTTGKPSDLGGLPHELGSTGYGVFISTLVALDHLNLKPEETTFAVEGFGNVGTFAAKFLTEKGSKLVAVSDSQGVIENQEGIDYPELQKTKNETKSVVNYEKATKTENILEAKADILITAAIPDLINENDIEKLNFKLIVQGSNIPATPETEQKLHEKNILVIPDFVANSGGVISSYVEHIEGTEQQMFEMIKEKIEKNTRLVLEKSKEKNIKPRDAALEIAEERLLN